MEIRYVIFLRTNVAIYQYRDLHNLSEKNGAKEPHFTSMHLLLLAVKLAYTGSSSPYQMSPNHQKHQLISHQSFVVSEKSTVSV